MWTSKSFQASIERAGFYQLRFGPELVTALWAGEPKATLHLPNSRRETVALALLDQAAKLRDTGGTANEKLDSAWVTDQVRFPLLGDTNFPWKHTYGAREPPISA